MRKDLIQLQKKAIGDKRLRDKFLETKNASDPMDAFCRLCSENGCEITVGELIFMGEDFCDAMLRSVNGGGVEAPNFWADEYELFMSALEKCD